MLEFHCIEMFRRTLPFGLVSALPPLFAFSANWTFDTKVSHPPLSYPSHALLTHEPKGFNEISPPIQSLATPKSLSLTGVGMRRKNLYLVEIDVYLASLALSPNALSNAKTSIQTGGPIADAIITSREGGSIPQPIAIVTLRFQRDVDAQTFALGFNDVFAGLPANELGVFQQQMKASIDTGAKKGDDISLVWMEGGNLIFLKNGKVGETFSNPVFEKRLLEAYVDSKRAVSPELIKSIVANIPNM